MESIDSIVMFEGKTDAAPAADVTGEATPQGEATATPAGSANTAQQERDEQGKFKARAASEPAAATTEQTVSTEPARAEKGQMSALLAERGRRQQAEAETAKLRAQLAAYESGNGQQSQGTDYFTDPQAAIREGVQREIAPLRNRLFQSSIEAASAAHPDYEDAIGHFIALAENDPALREQWLAHENPGEFAYFIGTSTPQYRGQREKSFTDKISAAEAENATLKARIAELEGARKTIADLPQSLSRQPSGSQPASQRGDEFDINNIVRFR